MEGFAEHVARDARLVILKALWEETDNSLNDVLLQKALEAFGHYKSREYVVTQLNALKELGAVTLRKAGTVTVATITRAGADHVERRGIIEGVARPSPGE